MCLMANRVPPSLSRRRLRWNRRAATVIGALMVLVGVPLALALAYETRHWQPVFLAPLFAVYGVRVFAHRLDYSDPADT